MSLTRIGLAPKKDLNVLVFFKNAEQQNLFRRQYKMTTENGNKSKERGLVIKDEDGLPISLFKIPSCYQDSVEHVIVPHGLIIDRIQQLANEIHAQIGDKPLTMLCILKGSFRFFTDLIQHLSDIRSKCSSPIQVEFVRVQSYLNASSTGQHVIDGLDSLKKSQALQGKQVLLVDDIIDSGLTLTRMIAELEPMVGANGRVWSALLLSKRMASRSPGVLRGDFIAFSIPDKFIVGYGLDYNQMFRDLQHICALNAVGKEKFKK